LRRIAINQSLNDRLRTELSSYGLTGNEGSNKGDRKNGGKNGGGKNGGGKNGDKDENMLTTNMERMATRATVAEAPHFEVVTHIMAITLEAGQTGVLRNINRDSTTSRRIKQENANSVPRRKGIISGQQENAKNVQRRKGIISGQQENANSRIFASFHQDWFNKVFIDVFYLEHLDLKGIIGVGKCGRHAEKSWTRRSSQTS